MTKNKDAGRAKPSERRTQVKDLPQSEKELSKAEQKKVKGGPTSMGWLPAMNSGGTGGSN